MLGVLYEILSANVASTMPDEDKVPSEWELYHYTATLNCTLSFQSQCDALSVGPVSLQ